ncbi:SAM-dependent methyltransferase [Mycobacterium sp. 852002-51057_SCH5723018]|uniref:SAM-dependent methyltransferase n=1 Tax=Mycobacterium sp. 852002-51057_SCH5723018 TaxID=1834094 RepID=UPI000801D6F4|nr:SAM-dependent methyltransferase [Mycobacterium sp. 852002-51057_SCH5723018]OBG21021.1 SAM-dependent methyltransferase [Mycobacterium sp. 852002-51057_SCH5723018]
MAREIWNPATGDGLATTFDAVVRVVATNKGLIADPFAEPLVRAAGVEYFARVIDDQRYAADDGDHPTTTGLIHMQAAFGRFLDEFLAASGRSGLRQVVILGSGLDTRPYRLWWPRGTTVYEIDRPEVLDFKAEVLAGLQATPAVSRREIGADLRQDWLTALHRAGFDAAQPTVWVAEQLLVGLLPPDAQNRLLREVTESSAAGSRFAADHMAIWTPARQQAREAFVDSWRQTGLEVDLASLTYPGEYGHVPEYLGAHGWETVERNVVELFAEVGLSELWRGGPDDLAVTPGYVTAVRVEPPGMLPGDER